MALFGSDWLDDELDYDKNYSTPQVEDYNPMKEYENYHSLYNDNDYDSMDEYEKGIKHFQE